MKAAAAAAGEGAADTGESAVDASAPSQEEEEQMDTNN